VVRYRCTEARLRKIEPFALAFALAFGLAFTIAPGVVNLYNVSNLWCWISPDFNECVSTTTVRRGRIALTAPTRRGGLGTIPLSGRALSE